ncbi:MAG: hypothetical protein IPI44_00275 [Sulfuritalea sp.]|nr:hypothetical protein [Sulfuritalea sp.]
MAMGERFHIDCIEFDYSIPWRHFNAMTRLDLAAKLADHARMDAQAEMARGADRPLATPRPQRSRRAIWALGLLAVAAVTAVAFGAYRQPELLLNLMGLRYCG